MELRTETLPIACVEGWSTTQDWTGVPLRDLAALAGIEGDAEATAESLQKFGSFRRRRYASGQVANPALAAGAAGQRRRPLAGPRLPGARDRSRGAGRPLHQVGLVDQLRGGLMSGCASATATARCT